jgi:hypothetical protein
VTLVVKWCSAVWCGVWVVRCSVDPGTLLGLAAAADANSTASTASRLQVRTFSEEVMEGVLVHFHIIIYDGGAYVWVGRRGSLNSLAVAIPTRCGVLRPSPRCTRCTPCSRYCYCYCYCFSGPS